MTRPRERLTLLAGIALLGAAWAVAVHSVPAAPFTAHMAAHLAVVALASPLLALGVAGTPLDPLPAAPWAFAALPAAVVEMAVVWGWHLPALRAAVASAPAVLALEQASFLLAGFLLWRSVLHATGPGVVGLLLTSMHMTLLGVLLTLAPRPLYPQGLCLGGAALAPLDDQAVGGVLMLAVGGTVYLAGGLVLVARLLRGGVGDTMPMFGHAEPK